jgi:hypothetical protein
MPFTLVLRSGKQLIMVVTSGAPGIYIAKLPLKKGNKG